MLVFLLFQVDYAADDINGWPFSYLTHTHQIDCNPSNISLFQQVSMPLFRRLVPTSTPSVVKHCSDALAHNSSNNRQPESPSPITYSHRFFVWFPCVINVLPRPPCWSTCNAPINTPPIQVHIHRCPTVSMPTVDFGELKITNKQITDITVTMMKTTESRSTMNQIFSHTTRVIKHIRFLSSQSSKQIKHQSKQFIV